ncbi:pre-rRNA-processing protein esf1 [Rhizopus azygosporus]|uniref:Pre-rRNA-processing protein esf1 n=1 Tax=Rhizopus azygosporus TaxID=86630 RepID=A0A367KBA5_RHIAZ|nr:pre-rRNA-processing protein esf1 [Rhizopus azygosporus]
MAKQHNNNVKKPVTKDPRFANVHHDPRFMRPKKQDMKVTIDKRFASMMNSAEFSDAPRVDKYGRKLKQNTAEKQLKRYYKLEEDEEERSDEEQTLEELEKELADDEENLLDEKLLAGYDPMRGRGEISSSDEEEDTDEDEEDLESEPDEMDAIRRIHEGDETHRLALVNMDWDKIKAVDILKALNGFKPDTGIIKSVTIYPSEFGKERLAAEEVSGPPREIFKKKDRSDSESDEEEEEEITAETIIKNQVEEGDGRDFDQDALRKYQLDRLKYYYAVVECDSAQTAKIIYNACDNTEYENSANFFDLRYIPDDMSFNNEEIKDKATIVPDNYAPTRFTTEALQNTKVKLTWDEDDVDRYQTLRREFTQDDLKNLDFDAYLASSDDEEETEDVEALKEKYRKLLESNNGNAYEDKVDEEDGEEGDMEITFTPGLSEAASVAVKNQLEEDKEETTIEKYMRKVKEKKQAKKAAKQQNNKTPKDEDESDIDADMESDPYFKEALSEMAEEGFVDADDSEKKAKKKRASREEREQKARERAELELLMGDDGKDEGFNMKEVLKREKMEKKKKGKKGKKVEETEDDFELDINDPRFSAIQESHHFAIDPTNPQFKKTKNMQKLLSARHTKMKKDNKEKDEWKKDQRGAKRQKVKHT